MPNYHARPLPAIHESEYRTDWLTPDGDFLITFDPETSLYSVMERMLSRLGDGPMRVHWVEVLADVEQEIITEALNVKLYPFDSEPSPEYSGVGFDPRTVHDPEPGEWLTPGEFFGGSDNG